VTAAHLGAHASGCVGRSSSSGATGVGAARRVAGSGSTAPLNAAAATARRVQNARMRRQASSSVGTGAANTSRTQFAAPNATPGSRNTDSSSSSACTNSRSSEMPLSAGTSRRICRRGGGGMRSRHSFNTHRRIRCPEYAQARRRQQLLDRHQHCRHCDHHRSDHAPTLQHSLPATVGSDISSTTRAGRHAQEQKCCYNRGRAPACTSHPRACPSRAAPASLRAPRARQRRASRAGTACARRMRPSPPRPPTPPPARARQAAQPAARCWGPLTAASARASRLGCLRARRNGRAVAPSRGAIRARAASWRRSRS
jgi:hypothetical protein